MELLFLRNIIIISGLATLIILLFHRFRIPTIIGFILTGMLVGPHGLGLIRETSQVDNLANIGLILLLFVIGIEFSPKSFLSLGKPILTAGVLQIMLAAFAGYALALVYGRPLEESLLIGLLTSLSSTAIVLAIIQERGEIDTPYGNTALGILILQDIAVVPMMLLIPLLAGRSGNLSEALLEFLFKAVGVVLLAIIGMRWVAPFILYQIARTRNREIFLISIITLSFAIAWLTSTIGLSLALGAFLAGLIISESEYSRDILGSVLPLRNVFSSFFFVSIGMLIDISQIAEQIVTVLALTIGILILKIISSAIAPAIAGFPFRISLLTGFALSQIGEFSFILARTGLSVGLLTTSTFQLLLAVASLTLFITPFAIALAPQAVSMLARLPLPKTLIVGRFPLQELKIEEKRDHLIIVGYGFTGRNLARAASAANIPYLILDLNPEIVRKERAAGEPIYFGDATQEPVLEHAGIKTARVMVIAIHDAAAERRIVELASRLNPNVYIIARTHYISELEPLYRLGADEVVPEEYETAVEIFTRVLNVYLVPQEDIEKFINELRAYSYEMLRSISRKRAVPAEIRLKLPETAISEVKLAAGSPAAGKTLAELSLRKRYGVSVLAIHRNHQTIPNPDGDTRLYAGDRLVIVGTKDKLNVAESLFGNPEVA
ncbi:MAG: cation:proton antiporter [Firmicutes bacterium]|nr:cation:proton antiporter [Bacillota bacterium]